MNPFDESLRAIENLDVPTLDEFEEFVGLYTDPEKLLEDPDYVAAPCGLVIHVDDEHDPAECELCEEQGRR